VLLNEVYPGGPADRAGLHVGDIVTDVQGHEVDDADSLRFRVATLPLGGSTTIAALHQGAAHQYSVALMAPPETPPRDTTPLGGNNPLTGAVVANLSPALADELRLDGQPRGVIVLEVQPRSRAAQLGLARGDVILKVNEHDVGAVKQLEAQLAERAGKWRLSVRRGREVLNVVVNG
jgi:serine protease Do